MKMTPALRSLAMKPYWPARRTLPQIKFEINKMAQDIQQATVMTLKKMSSVVKRIKDLDDNNEDVLKYLAVDLENPMIVTPFDASFANKEGGKSQPPQTRRLSRATQTPP